MEVRGYVLINKFKLELFKKYLKNINAKTHSIEVIDRDFVKVIFTMKFNVRRCKFISLFDNYTMTIFKYFKKNGEEKLFYFS